MKTELFIEQAFKRAITFFESGYITQAKEIYEKILQEDNNSFDAHHLLGICHFQLNSFEDSIISIKKAIKLNPEILKSYIDLGDSYRALKQYENAQSAYEEVLEKNPNSAIAYHGLGLSYKEKKEYNKALTFFKKAIKLDRNFFICYYDMANTYEKLNKFELYFFYLEKTININPDFYDALFSMAQYYRKTKNEKKMKVYLEKTLEKQPKHPGANHLLASLNQEADSIYSLEYAEELFDRYADFFEAHLVDTLNYQVPFIIKEKLKYLNPPRSSKVLDLGCGTGLLGKTVVDMFPSLVGVDISANMIAEARKKEIYTTLHTKDINEFLSKNEQEFDLIIAPDVFIYIGDLKTIFSRVKTILKNNGYYIFTIEDDSNINTVDFQLGKSGRFSHTIKYVDSLCKENGFEIVDKEQIILREENKIGQEGIIYILKNQ